MNPRSITLSLALAFATISSLQLGGAESEAKPEPIDLPTALKLAGARSLDVQIARERLAEAKANHSGALARFFPWIAPSVSYQQHDGKIQDVAGNILTVHKDSYAAGGALSAQVNIGEALYSSLVAKQLVKAADHALESQRQDTIFVAAQGYYELALAQGSVGVAKDALRISRDYEAQINQAVSAGIAFKGDALRVIVQKQRNELALRQARERQRIAAARLSQVLHLDPSVELLAQDSELAPLSLVDTNVSLQTLMREAVSSRPELKQSHALAMAAREEKNGSRVRPAHPLARRPGLFWGLGRGPERHSGHVRR